MKKTLNFGISLVFAMTISAEAQIVTPVNLNGWGPANVRTDASVAITGDEPRSGLGSLKFSFVTVTPGQDKADFEKIWGVVPGRTLGALSALRYEFYRASSSTTAGHFAPVLRLYYYNDVTGESGLLIWEPVYNGYGTITTDTWISADIFTGNFWMRAFGPGRTIDDYNVSLAEWMANSDEEGSPIDDDSDADVPHVLGPGIYITGINVGVGSGWGANFLGFVDNVEIEFGTDVETANFELPPPCTTDCYVDDAIGNDANGGTNPVTDAKKTIQNAVNTVNVGGTVHVAGGNYVEQVEIDKAVTVRGAGATTVVKSPATLTKYFTTSANNYPIIWVHDADNVVIEDLVVDGAGNGNANYRFVGIGYDNAGGKIEDVEIKDVRDTPISGSQHGVGILAYSAEGTARALTVNRCNIHDYQKNATVFSGADLVATVTSNTITGAGAVNFIAQNGIQVSGGATGDINDNMVSGHSYTPYTYVACGILLYGSNANTAENVLNENQVGIYHINGSGTHQQNNLSATAAGTGSPGFWGIVADPGDMTRAVPSPFDVGASGTAGLQKSGPLHTVNATYSSLLDQNILTSDGSAGGVGIEADALGTDVLNFTATANTVANWEYGIYLYKDASATLNANIVDCNQIYGNTAYGLFNSTGVDANAVGNWWGAASGPTHASNIGGSGDAVSDYVTFAPWGTDASCGGLLSHNYVFLADYVSIERSKQIPSQGNIHSNGKIDFLRGDPTVFEGNLTAVGKITIGKENTIDGYAHSAGIVSVHPTSNVLGGTVSGAFINAEPLPSLSYTAGGPNKTIPQNGTLALAPGSYNVVTMNDWSTLKLSSGDYYLNQLKYVGEESVIEIDVSNGPVTVNVVSNLQLGKDIAIQIVPDGEAGSTKVTFNTRQTTTMTIGKEAYVLGNINAPSATVVLSNNSQFRGGLCAKALQVKRDVFFLHHFSSGTLPGPGNLPKSIDGKSEETATVVTEYQLTQNYPNPFNPSTVIKFALPQAGRVQLHIYNSAGQVVRELANGDLAQGWHELTWDGRDHNGQTVATGVYLYRLTVQDPSGTITFAETRRMTMVK